MRSWLTKIVSQIVAAWDTFWFAPQDLIGLALFRIVFCTNAFFFYLCRQFDFEFFFSDKGFLPYSVAVSSIPPAYTSPIPWAALASNPTIGLALHTLFLCLLAGLALGLVSRKAAWGAFVLHLVFMCRNLLSTYGTDQVTLMWLLYLSFTKANTYLALRWPWEKKKGQWSTKKSELTKDLCSSVGIRLIQVQICIIYAYSGFEKARGNSWWQGDAIWDTLANGQIVSLNFSFLHYFPLLLTAMTFTVVLWEVYFPMAMWNPKIRPFWLVLGVMMHVGIALFMHLPYFATAMVAPYFLFMDSTFLRKTLGRFIPKTTFLVPSPLRSKRA